MNYVDVASIDTAIEKAAKLGAQVALCMPPVPGAGTIACLLDPEDYIFGLMQRSPG
jgi:predicted enzyme related to lactoylglutathione lyase